MNYNEYAKAFNLRVDAGSVDYILQKDGFCLYENSKPLYTPGGNLITDPSEELIRMVATDIQLIQPDAHPEFLSAVLYSFSKDVLDGGQDPFLLQWEEIAAGDPFVRMKTMEKPALQPLDPDALLFSFAIHTLSGLTKAIGRMSEQIISEIALEEDEANPFSMVLEHLYERMSPYRKAAVQALSTVHQAGLVLPLMVVGGHISGGEYVKGLVSLGLQPVEAYNQKLGEVARVLDFAGSRFPASNQETPVQVLISSGEGDQVEYKSTLRWDIRAGKTNPAIERASLKTIAAFLNTSGGTLLIGVRDDGSIEGIETDKFFNEDKFLLHLWTLIRNCLGRDLSPYIRTRIEKMDNKGICVVTCYLAARPAYLRQPGFDEELYIRVGPSSNALDISEAVRYIGDRFGTVR